MEKNKWLQKNGGRAPSAPYLESASDIGIYVIAILILYYKTFLAEYKTSDKIFHAKYKTSVYIIIILCLYYKTFVTNVTLWSLRHKRSTLAEHHAQLYTKSPAYVVHSLHISSIFVKTKLTMAGWLKEKTERNWKNRQPILLQ